MNYNKQKNSMFIYAYRAFVDALCDGDSSTLKKMTDRNVYKAIMRDKHQIEKHNFKYVKVNKDIKMKIRLLDF